MWASSLSSIAILYPLSSCSSNNSDLEHLLALPISLSYIFNEEKISALGKSYLDKFQIKNKKRHLKKLLMESFDIKDESKLMNDSSYVLNRLLQKIKTDFETNQTIEIDGWILSVTEAQQCALFFLTNN